MKTVEQIQAELKALENVFGFNPLDYEQGSEPWQVMKLGVLSASKCSEIVAKVGSATRSTYMAELVAQVCTGVFDEINAKALAWGKEHEDAARAAYSFKTGHEVVELPFIFKDESLRAGISPDGIGNTKGLELKCPATSKIYVQFLTDEKIKPEYEKQCQFSMWVTGYEQWSFANYDPRMQKNQIHNIDIDRNEKFMATLDDAVPQFIYDMDQMLLKTGCAFGEQWIRFKEKLAEIEKAS